MDYTHLGRSGVSVSRFCLGTMNFGWTTEEPDAHQIMDRAHEHGINFFDCSNTYGHPRAEGVAEQMIGRWFAAGNGRRDRTVLATKVYGGKGEWPNDRFLSALNIRRACDDSLRRLGTDHIDLYQMHHVDRCHPVGGDLGGDGRPPRPREDHLRRVVELRRLAHRPGPGDRPRAALVWPGQ